ncbi:MAG: Adenosine deaminase [Pseudonocardiales bacterium]|nr:Adenosine deaminase [Pseudonocardiales bacterium]
MPAPVTLDAIVRAPKVELHDHLDGGLRPQSVLELADELGYPNLPAGIDDAAALGNWFRDAANSGSLVRYLEGFAHTVGVMASESALFRVARECAQDLAADGVVYAEVRYAPELWLDVDLPMPAVIEAVNAGLRAGEQIAAAAGHRISVGVLLCAMRQNERAMDVAELVVRYRDAGVAGFDIAGPEDGFSPMRQADAFEYLRRESARYTAHAGEAAGVQSIWEALAFCGTERLGHGVRIIEDVTFSPDADPVLGRVAQYVRDRRIPLEVAPSSNLQTGIAATIAEHPFEALRRLGFAVTVNTDNRLMSATSVSRETALLAEAHGYGWGELQHFTQDALRASFLPEPDQAALRHDVIDPAYAALLSA